MRVVRTIIIRTTMKVKRSCGEYLETLSDAPRYWGQRRALLRISYLTKSRAPTLEIAIWVHFQGNVHVWKGHWRLFRCLWTFPGAFWGSLGACQSALWRFSGAFGVSRAFWRLLRCFSGRISGAFRRFSGRIFGATGRFFLLLHFLINRRSPRRCREVILSISLCIKKR